MAGLIPQTFLDDLLDRIDIIDVVDPRVKLKKTGKNYSACCPFHDEKTPSFTVSPDKQFYYCFGCGANGTALSFILEYDRLSFPDAVEELAKMAGIEVPREAKADSSQQQHRKSIHDILDKSDQYFRQQLRFSPAKQHAINYLKDRGLSGEITRDFGIGYAPPGWDNLIKAVGLTDEDKQLLIDGGMLIEKTEERKRYDRFRNRIMFPIKDVRGRVIGFGGRVLGDDKPKYLNSPETPVFHKGKELYGLYEARMAHKQLPRLLIVEGYMDVVALAQFGIRYGAATLGTACGEDHLNRAFKYTQEVVFCFDGDQAGRTAARRALENSLATMEDGRRIKFLFLPDGEDPDTLIRQLGAEKFTQLIDVAVPLEDFLFDHVSEDLDPQSMEGRARLSKRAAPLLNKLPSGVFRELMFANLAQRTGLSLDILMELIDSPIEPSHPQPHSNKQIDTQQGKPHSTENVDSTPYPDNIAPNSEHWGEIPDHHFDTHEQDHSYYEDSGDINTPYDIEPQPASSALYPSDSIKLPPQKLLIAILLQHPELAQHTPTASKRPLISASTNPDIQLFLELNELLQQRPHYDKVRILGFWKGTKTAQAISHLEALAQTSLPGEARRRNNYDEKQEYIDIITQIESSLQQPKTQELLENLTRKNFNELSDDEKQQLKQLLYSQRPQ